MRWIPAFAGMTMELLVVGGARSPHHRRGRLIVCRAAVPGLVERMAKTADNQPAHRRRVTEANFGLGRVDVDVDVLEWNLEEQRRDRMAVARDEIAVGGAQRPDQQPVL